MNCALCGNEENLLIQVQAGSGLSLRLCPEHEHLPLFEVAAMLAAENEALVARIVKLRAVVDAALEIEYILRCSGGSKDVDSFTAQPLRIALNDAGISLWEEEDSE